MFCPGGNAVNKRCKTRAGPCVSLPLGVHARGPPSRTTRSYYARKWPRGRSNQTTPGSNAPAGFLHLALAAPGPLPLLTFVDPRPTHSEREAPAELRHTLPASAPRLPPAAGPTTLPALARPPDSAPHIRPRPHQSTEPSQPLACSKARGGAYAHSAPPLAR